MLYVSHFEGQGTGRGRGRPLPTGGKAATAVRLPSCVMSPRDWTTSQLAHAFVLGAVIDGAVNSERQRWGREGPNGTDELWFVRTRQLWWTSSYVRPTYSILLSYLFIYLLFLGAAA